MTEDGYHSRDLSAPPDRIGFRRVFPGPPRREEVGFAWWSQTLGRIVFDDVFRSVIRARPPLPEPRDGESLETYRARLFNVFGNRGR